MPPILRCEYIQYMADRFFGGDLSAAENEVRPAELKLYEEMFGKLNVIYYIPDEVGNDTNGNKSENKGA